MNEDPDTSIDLLFFRAGYLAAEHGLQQATLAMTESLEALDPSGPPLVVALDSSDITVQVARTLAAVAGAGRQVVVVSPSGEIPADARPWLGDRIKVLGANKSDKVPPSGGADGGYPELDQRRSSDNLSQTNAAGSAKDQPREEAPSGDGSFAGVPGNPAVDPPEAAGDYCGVEWAAAPLALGGPQGSNYLDRLVREFKLKGTREVATFSALFPSTPNPLASCVEFVACRVSGRERITIRTPIAVTPSGHYWSAIARDAFGWYVLRWAEQPTPKKAKGLGRWMGRSRPSLCPFEHEEACFPGAGERPQRVMSLSTRFLLARADILARTRMADLGDKSALLLEYRLPLVDWHNFKGWASRSITSLLRVQHLLYQPQWSLSTARDGQSEGPAVTRLLSSQRAIPYGLAVRRLAESGGEPVKAPGPVNAWSL